MVSTNIGSIADFYARKSVFVTGGTGFLGKVLIEKLLYGCPEIDNIYMLVREKKGLTINQRINNYFEDPLFERLKDKRPQNLKKLIPIAGDVNSPNLGISRADEKILIEKTSVVVHAAATVKFNEPLKVAWKTNVEGTKMMLDLAQRMKRVEVFIHISTAYSNTRDVLEEKLYPAPATMDEMYQLLKQDLTEEDTRRIIGDRPNTYVFTKAVTEHLVAENQAYMPTIIIRPSIVSAINNNPIKGWLNNWYGASGILVAITKGLNRVIYGQGSNAIDLIPVDYVINLVIAAGAKCNRSNKLQIYNSCSSGCNPVTIERLIELFGADIMKQRLYVLPFPQLYLFTKHLWLGSIVTFFFQMIPAYLADIFLYLSGKQPMYVKLQHRIVEIRNSISFFSRRTWHMKSNGTQELYASLQPSDKEIFPCNPANINWNEYIKDYSAGVRKFLEKPK